MVRFYSRNCRIINKCQEIERKTAGKYREKRFLKMFFQNNEHKPNTYDSKIELNKFHFKQITNN